ncbi:MULTISPECIES: hypothetical protein [unclassified Streptomyces]|uniref:hypothetical protein n=1 Tax=unclassified Streptomyces TaxID=2593676 RepID=UPI002E364347|nr:hypothetical protein [Streptomyces sp. NBC_01268]
MTGTGGGGGLYALMTGVWMTAYGVVVATDFRGAAQRMDEMSARSGGVRFTRLLAGVFALVGPVVLTLGVSRTVRGDALTGSPRLPLPFLAVLLAVGALITWTHWRPGGLLRREWSAGGRGRRVAAVVSTCGVLGFVAGLGLGLQLLWVASWSIAAGAGLLLLVAGRAGQRSA